MLPGQLERRVQHSCRSSSNTRRRTRTSCGSTCSETAQIAASVSGLVAVAYSSRSRHHWHCNRTRVYVVIHWTNLAGTLLQNNIAFIKSLRLSVGRQNAPSARPRGEMYVLLEESTADQRHNSTILPTANLVPEVPLLVPPLGPMFGEFPMSDGFSPAYHYLRFVCLPFTHGDYVLVTMLSTEQKRAQNTKQSS